MSVIGPITADQITIAVTVFSRRQYVKQATASALNQTLPVRVIVVEDCGPDAGMKEFVMSEFGARIEYIRNPKRRGLFDNWNACLECCRTPWLSILHDDDYLTPLFAEAMIRLSQNAPDCALYFGRSQVIDDSGQLHPELQRPPIDLPWQHVSVADFQFATLFPFAGQLISVAHARALGGFRPRSQFCGDWEMWANLVDRGGGAETAQEVAYTRTHSGGDRGCNVVERSGRMFALSYVQRKRVLALMRQRGESARLDRRKDQAALPVPAGMLIRHGAEMSARLFNYNCRLLAISSSPNLAHAMVKWIARIGGPRVVRWLAFGWAAATRRRNPTAKRQP